MTWYANNIYTQYSTELEKALLEIFPEFVYHIKEFGAGQFPKCHNSVFPWRRKKAFELPNKGILSVRPISASKKVHLHEWYSEPLVSWDNMKIKVSKNYLKINPLLLRDVVDEPIPPVEFLSLLKYISFKYDKPIMYYQCFMWGGCVESEFAFVYSKEVEYLYCHFENKNDTKNSYYKSYINTDEPKIIKGGVLSIALSHLDMYADIPYFIPHSGSFDWPKYRV
jgi:hypothetical protein